MSPDFHPVRPPEICRNDATTAGLPTGTRPGALRFCRTNPHRGRNVPLSSLRREGASKNPLFPLIASLWVPAEWIKWSFPGGRGRRRKALPHLPLLMSQLRKCRCGSAAPLLHVENFFRWRYCTGLTIFVTVLSSIRHGRWPKYPIDKKYQ